MNDLRDALGTLHSPCEGEPRIVSLVPSLTELLCQLGLAANLVGRSGFCIHPREIVQGIPKMGGTKDADIAAIRYPQIDAVSQGLTFVDRVLLSTEPYRFAEQHVAEAESRFGVPAQLIDGEMVSWYGSRAAAGLRYLARLRQARPGQSRG